MASVKLGEVAQEYKETCKGSKDGYPLVGLEHLVPSDLNLSMWEDEKENTFTKMFCKGQVLFGRRRAYLKKAAVAPFDGICSGDITVIEANPERILPELLPFIIQNDRLFDFAVGKSAGSLSPRVKWEHLRDYEFNLPDMTKQKQLAEVLWAVNTTREAYKTLLLVTDEMLKSQFNDMFENDRYEKKCLGELSILWLKGQPLKKDELFDGGENSCIHYGELFTKYGPVINAVFSKTNAIAKRNSKKGDILFPASDVTPDGLARCSVLMHDNIILGGDIIIMRPSPCNNPIYLSYAINFQKMQLLSRVTGAVVRHLSGNSLKSVVIPIPPMKLQDEFEAFTHQIDKSKFELQKTLEDLVSSSRTLINHFLE